MRRLALSSLMTCVLAACSNTRLATGPEGDEEARSPSFAVSAIANGYVAIDLGTLGGSESLAYAINNLGQVTGESATAADAETHAFLWRAGVMTDLGTLGGSVSEGSAINDAGQVTGFSLLPDGWTRAFRWAGGVMTDLGTLGGRYSYAVAINRAGLVTGTSETAAGQVHAFRWANGVMTDLGTLGGNYSDAVAINDAGQVTGISATAAGEAHAFLWDDGVMIDLGAMGGSGSEGVAINNLGQVTGQRIVSGEYRAFLWQNGVMTDLGTLGGAYTRVGGGFSCRCLPFNNLGQVTGISSTASGESHAFVWQSGVMTDLGTLGTNSSLGNGSHGFAINNAGQVTGESTFPGPGFDRRAFLWHRGAMLNLGTLGGSFSRGTAINDLGQVAGFSSTAEDAEAHATLWRVVTPVGQIEGIILQVNQLQATGALGQGQANSLIQKLQGVIAKLNEGKTIPAVNQLEAFINEVTALMSGNNPVLTPAQGQPLIGAANAVIAALGS